MGTFQEYLDDAKFHHSIVIEKNRIDERVVYEYARDTVSGIPDLDDERSFDSDDISSFDERNVIEWMFQAIWDDEDFNNKIYEALGEDGNGEVDESSLQAELIELVNSRFDINVTASDIADTNFVVHPCDPRSHGFTFPVFIYDSSIPAVAILSDRIDQLRAAKHAEIDAYTATDWVNLTDSSDNHLFIAAVFGDVTGYYYSGNGSVYAEVGVLKIRFADHENQSGLHNDADWNCGSFSGADSLWDVLKAVYVHLDQDEAAA